MLFKVRSAIAHQKKGGEHAPFLNCTSEVTQWFLYINVTPLHRN